MVLTNAVRVEGAGLFTIDPANAQTAIQAAIDSLGSSGGLVEIYAGASEYTFTGAVTSTKNNVTVRGLGAVLKIDGSATLYMFRVQGQNWTFEGLNFSILASSGFASSQAKMISIEDAGTSGASDTTRILSCKFHATLATQTVKNLICISAIGNVTSSAEMRRGLLIQGCTFIAGVNSMPNEVDDGTVPYGITFIKTDGSGAQRIIGNDFRGDVEYSTLENVPDGADPQLLEIAINATVAVTGTTIVLKSTATDPTLTGIVQPGSTLTIAGDATTYKVTKQATAGSDLITLNIWPPLVVEATEDDVVAITTTLAYGHVASAISLLDHNQSIVSNNTFVLMTCQAAASGEGGALIHSRGEAGESGHSKIECNIFEDIDAWYVVRVEKVSGGAHQNLWTHTQWNEFGRMIPRIEAVISYEDAGVAKIIGNSFHNIGGGLHGTVQTHGYPISLTNCKTVLIDQNIGSIMATTENLYHDGGGNSNIRYGPGNLWEWDYA